MLPDPAEPLWTLTAKHGFTRLLATRSMVELRSAFPGGSSWLARVEMTIDDGKLSEFADWARGVAASLWESRGDFDFESRRFDLGTRPGTLEVHVGKTAERLGRATLLQGPGDVAAVVSLRDDQGAYLRADPVMVLSVTSLEHFAAEAAASLRG